jgi:hypothetical protein
MAPAERHQLRHQPVEQRRGVGIRLRRAPERVSHVVLRTIPEERSAIPGAMDAAKPISQRFAGRPGPDRIPAAEEFLQGEHAWPHIRQHDHGVPDMFPGHREHQVSPGQVDRGDLTAAMRSGVKPMDGYGPDRLGRRWLTVAQHPGRAD